MDEPTTKEIKHLSERISALEEAVSQIDNMLSITSKVIEALVRLAIRKESHERMEVSDKHKIT